MLTQSLCYPVVEHAYHVMLNEWTDRKGSHHGHIYGKLILLQFP